jgi:hypothetical protein
VGFPRFKSRRRSRVSCRFTTGAIRVDDRTHVVLPRIGRVKTHEATVALLAAVAAGTARILAATVSFEGRRWYRAFTVEAGAAPGRPAHVGADRAHPVIGVDVGVRDLLVAGAPDGAEVARVPHRSRWHGRRRGCGPCSGRLPADAARTGAPGNGPPAGGARPRTGSGASTPGPLTCAPMRCTRSLPRWPSGTR